MADDHKNFAYGTVLTAPSPATSGTSLVLQSGEGAKFPTPPFNTTVWPVGAQPATTNAEIVRVTAIATDTLTITRAQEGTSARTVVVGDQVAASITRKTLLDVETFAVVSKTTTYTATANDQVILADATSAAFTINLPAAASHTGRCFVIKKTDSSVNAVTIDPNGSETIEGATTAKLTKQYHQFQMVSNGTNWFVIDDIHRLTTISTVLYRTILAGGGKTYAIASGEVDTQVTLLATTPFPNGTLNFAITPGPIDSNWSYILRSMTNPRNNAGALIIDVHSQSGVSQNATFQWWVEGY